MKLKGLMAVDCNIPFIVRYKYQRLGWKMVYRVRESVPDEVWVEDAVLNFNVDLILSRDLDIPNLLDKLDFDFVQWKEC